MVQPQYAGHKVCARDVNQTLGSPLRPRRHHRGHRRLTNPTPMRPRHSGGTPLPAPDPVLTGRAAAILTRHGA